MELVHPSEREQIYVCPMHGAVRQSGPGKCSICAMALVPEGTRLPLLRHLVSNRLHLIVMSWLMLLLMAAAMVMLMMW